MVRVELGDDLARLAAACRRTRASRPVSAPFCISARSFSIVAGDVRAQHLDRRRRAVGKRRPRCTWATEALATGVAVERTKDLLDRLAVDALQGRDHLLAGKRRNAVLQAGKLVGDVGAAGDRGASRASART